MQITNNHVVEATDGNVEKLQQTSSVLLLEFTATWCPSCKMMDPILEGLASNFTGLATIGKVDVEENARLTTQYGIRNIPAMLIFKDGQLVKRFTGVTSPSVLRAELSGLVSQKEVLI